MPRPRKFKVRRHPLFYLPAYSDLTASAHLPVKILCAEEDPIGSTNKFLLVGILCQG